MREYITYGFTIDDPLNIETNLYNGLSINKPKKALWGSPVNADFGWKEYLECEHWCPDDKFESLDDYLKVSFKWTLAPGSKVFKIKNVVSLYWLETNGYIFKNEDQHYLISFEKMRLDGFTGVELTDPCMGHRFYNRLEISMNAWDCQSIVVLDPRKVLLL